MPSKAMIHYKCSLYEEQAVRLEDVRTTKNVPIARLLRESVNLVLERDDLTELVLMRCRRTAYRRTGANIGVYQSESQRWPNGKEEEKLRIRAS